MKLQKTILSKYVITIDNLLKYKDCDSSKNYIHFTNEIKSDITNLYTYIYDCVLNNKSANEINSNDLDYFENFDCYFIHDNVIITIYCNVKKESKLITHFDKFEKSNKVCQMTKDFFKSLREEIYRDDLPF